MRIPDDALTVIVAFLPASQGGRTHEAGETYAPLVELGTPDAPLSRSVRLVFENRGLVRQARMHALVLELGLPYRAGDRFALYEGNRRVADGLVLRAG